MGASSDLDQLFRPRQKSWVWVGGRIGHLVKTFALKDIPPSITVIARVKKNGAIGFAMFLLRELIRKYKHMRFEFLIKVIVALILE